MAGRNHSRVTEFVLLGFPDKQELLFVLFSLIYLTTLVGNLGMIVLIKTNPQFHVPMYFFLSHLSFLDICCSSSVAPTLLRGLLVERNLISFDSCMVQFFFYALLGTTEALLLAVMAYDRYVAIRAPLHYLFAMSRGVCVRLVAGSYAAGSLNAAVHTTSLLLLSFCGPNLVDHFSCEIPALLLLSCSDTRPVKVLLAVCVGCITAASVSAVVASYTCILKTTWRIPSGRYKAFSTCSSHLTAVALFYGSAAFLYFLPVSGQAADRGKIASVFYTMVTPMLNPVIYSLRNKEVRISLRR
ncbi:Olfactory receptor 1052, partial [Chaetura pelagica]